MSRQYDVLCARLQRRGVGKRDSNGDFQVEHPHLLYCADEKGFNDENLAGQSAVVTAGNANATAQHSKTLRHISVLTFASAAGEVAPPAVVVSGTMWHPDWQKIWPEAVVTASPRGSFTGEIFVKLAAETFIYHIRIVKKMKGWVVLLIDSGGGNLGMHLTMEFALLMSKNQVDVFALAEYHTKALMPLDRDPHREMQLDWGRARQEFSAQHGHTVNSQYQALALIREVWSRGSRSRFVQQGWKATGLCPWNPHEVVADQPGLFRAPLTVHASAEFRDASSKEHLRLPSTMIERRK